ncbi:hypothetical protein PgNI_06189 [Pyricularia grisea]|uniref:FHA domain-containing protein n=1 Tax=Pyricularia grisea TaxID=148305 RepID=A0A6P8B541_PYRGI|nr:hypothetical protein PgNI_06189 [Pyricularia grisea]TLD10456.1 hypothetical protein PgNI_06189 [Pyricularia grisea]
MWLLENEGDVFQGRQIWLRPGKKYLLGRGKGDSNNEAGDTIIVADKTISRKHATIQIDAVPEGHGELRASRSKVTIEDLKTKIGTVVNGKQIKGQTFALSEASNSFKLGHFAKMFRLNWKPVVLTFNFSSREERADPWSKLRESLEQLDIKFISEFDVQYTTHVVHKKRNTPRGLQALINGRYIVTESFIEQIQVATAPGDDGAPSLLEQDFSANWPNPLEHLPPRGDEPSMRPVETYEPDPRRREIFEGYTFIFYDQIQYENLMPMITNGKGKAMIREVTPFETQPDDFIRYVKEVAGEKGLGEFEDGSEGRGVVVVRFAPKKEGDLRTWFWNFGTEVMKRLDHRMIEASEFLDAILAVQPGMLRRPLEFEPTPVETPIEAAPPARATRTTRARTAQTAAAEANMASRQIQQPTADGEGVQVAAETRRSPTPPLQMTPPRATRRKGRFRGFDTSDDEEKPPPPEPEPSAPQSVPQEEYSQPMFVSQVYESQEPNSADTTRGTRSTRLGRKRAHSPVPVDEDEEMIDSAPPTTTTNKRRRLEPTQSSTSRLRQAVMPESDDDDEEAAPIPESPVAASVPAPEPAAEKPTVKTRRGAIDTEVLDAARQRLAETEAKVKKEEERYKVPDDGYTLEQLAEIRKLTLVDEMPVLNPGSGGRTREQDIADGRWDPRWNGRQNFKRFRKAVPGGDRTGSRAPAQRIIVGYVEEKNKVYGIGDEYWLEDPATLARKKSQSQGHGSASSATVGGATTSPVSAQTSSRRAVKGLDSSDDEDEDDLMEMGSRQVEPEEEEEEEPVLPRTRKGKAAEKAASQRSQRQTRQTQTQAAPSTGISTTTQSQRTTRAASGKRAATTSISNPRPAKKVARAQQIEASDSDDDDDDGGGRFRFGRR